MALKNLRQFLDFNQQEFFKNKKLCYLNCIELPEKKGVKITLLILEDNTDYTNEKNNLGEQITVKILDKNISYFSEFQPLKTHCNITNVKKAVVYGEFQNQLSIIGDVVKIGNGVKD
ncbi:hypothetical protein [Streptococcus uberis]|uniref:hypothetical protein n=1 Tax=Streptococcus uberis TaxID=1349 RepID=UPI003797E5C3